MKMEIGEATLVLWHIHWTKVIYMMWLECVSQPWFRRDFTNFGKRSDSIRHQSFWASVRARRIFLYFFSCRWQCHGDVTAMSRRQCRQKHFNGAHRVLIRSYGVLVGDWWRFKCVHVRIVVLYDQTMPLRFHGDICDFIARRLAFWIFLERHGNTRPWQTFKSSMSSSNQFSQLCFKFQTTQRYAYTGHVKQTVQIY